MLAGRTLKKGIHVYKDIFYSLNSSHATMAYYSMLYMPDNGMLLSVYLLLRMISFEELLAGMIQ
jgi:hypothetical protein